MNNKLQPKPFRTLKGIAKDRRRARRVIYRAHRNSMRSGAHYTDRYVVVMVREVMRAISDRRRSDLCN